MKKDLKYPKVTMLYDHILTSVITRKVTASGVIVNAGKRGEILNRQVVVAAGPNSSVEIGDEIELNVDRFPRKNIPAKNDIGPDGMLVIPPIEIIDSVEYLLISSREIKYIYDTSGEVN